MVPLKGGVNTTQPRTNLHLKHPNRIWHREKRKEKTFGSRVYKETVQPAQLPGGLPLGWGPACVRDASRPKIAVVLVDCIKRCLGPRGPVYTWLKGLRADKKVLSPVLLKHVTVLMFWRDRHVRSTWHRSRHQQCHQEVEAGAGYTSTCIHTSQPIQKARLLTWWRLTTQTISWDGFFLAMVLKFTLPPHASPATFLEPRGTRLKEQDNKSTQYRVRRERKGVSFSVHTGRVIPGHPLDLAQPRFPGLHAED